MCTCKFQHKKINFINDHLAVFLQIKIVFYCLRGHVEQTMYFFTTCITIRYSDSRFFIPIFEENKKYFLANRDQPLL